MSAERRSHRIKPLLAPLLAACLLLPVSGASLAKTLSLGLTLNGSGWEGDNGPGNSSFESSEGGQFAFSLNYRADQFYTGVNLQGGDYSFDSDAPAQFTSNGSLFSSDIKVEHSDFDLLVGYYFWPRVSLFMDLKAATSKWRDSGYEQTFSGLGFGASTFHVINQQWVLFGSIGFVNGSIDDNDVSSIGDGTSSALVFGAVRQIDADNAINFGLKLRSYDFEFDDGNEQEFTLNGVFFGYNRVFRW